MCWQLLQGYWVGLRRFAGGPSFPTVSSHSRIGVKEVMDPKSSGKKDLENLPTWCLPDPEQEPS